MTWREHDLIAASKSWLAIFSRVHVIQSLVVCVVFWSIVYFSSFVFLWQLNCLSFFDIRILIITYLVALNLSYKYRYFACWHLRDADILKLCIQMVCEHTTVSNLGHPTVVLWSLLRIQFQGNVLICKAVIIIKQISSSDLHSTKHK